MADIRMLGPDGKEYDVPDDKVDEAVKLGMKKQTRPVDPSPTKEFFKAGLEGAEGFAKGVIPGAVKMIPNAITGLAKGAMEAGEGAYGLVTDPAATLKKGAGAVADLPGQVKQAVTSAMDKAERDPEGFGRDVGETTGSAIAGIAAGRAVPMVSKPGAIRIGGKLEELGTRARFPMQLAGATQLASGHPVSGVMTMLTPSAIRASGEGLTKLGGGTTMAEGVELAKQSDAMNTMRSEMEKRISNVIRVGEKRQKAGLSDLDKNIAETKREAAKTRDAAARTEQRAINDELRADREHRTTVDKAAEEEALKAENERRLRIIEEASEGGEKGEPKISESISAETPEGGKKSMTVRIGKPKAPETTFGDLTAEEIAGLRKQGFSDASIQRLANENKGSVDPVRDLAGRLGGRRGSPDAPLPESWKKFAGAADEPKVTENLGDFMNKLDEALGKTPSGSKKGSGAWKNMSDNDASDAAAAYVSGERDPQKLVASILKNRKLRQQMHVSNHYADQPAPKQEPEE